MGLSNELSCESGSFFCCLNPHRIFQSEVFRLYLSMLEPWVVGLHGLSCFLVVPPSLSANANEGPHALPATAKHAPGILATTLPAPVLQLPPCCESSPPCCPSQPLLQVWTNVSSLTLWLSDLHTVQFSGSSGCFCF